MKKQASPALPHLDLRRPHLAVAALSGVGIPACPIGPSSTVKQEVIELIFTNHKIAIAIVGPSLIEVMHLNARWEEVAKNSFGDKIVLLNISTTRPWMVRSQ
jgi:hypothetical protein